ncbi:MAG: alpha-1,2-fucosyltransferase [Candidatus Gastranaerophilales bacterium]|nr:alpha-1,2-fucosyltransferase [Candidatus Gastranaerophilales bacterium]
MSNEKIFIVKFNGGLGNQMFQWAFARSLEKKTSFQAFFDMSYFTKKYARPYDLEIFNVNPRKIEDFWLKLRLEIIWKLRRRLKNKKFLGLKFYCEPHFEFDENIFQIEPNTYIEGFFQSEKYFKEIEDDLRNDFQFKNPPAKQNEELTAKIGTVNSVSLHIRRGDYVQKKRFQNLYAPCSLDYYRRGVEYIAQNYANPTLFIFSDDIEWVKQNLNLPYESVYVSHNTGKKSFEDMRLMSLCKHNIIANSSFSWWGAWLNNNPKKIVIAPQKWFNDENIVQIDVIPQNWIKLEN